MEVSAKAKGIRIAPRKTRPFVDAVRGKHVDEAMAILTFAPSPAARKVLRVVKSAVANAENNYQMEPSELRITQAYVDEGPMMKRIRFVGRGRVNPLLKRMCNITIVVEEMA